MFYPTTCVGLRYGPCKDMLSGFSREPDYHLYPIARGRSVLSGFSSRGGFACPSHSLRLLTRYSVSARMCHFSVSTIAPCRGNGMFTVCPSPLALRLGLRSRLTLIRLALIRNPWSYGDRVSRPVCRYLYLHLLFRYLQHALRHTFAGLRNAPLPIDP